MERQRPYRELIEGQQKGKTKDFVWIDKRVIGVIRMRRKKRI